MDVLFVLKENKRLTTNDIYNSKGLFYQFSKWNKDTRKAELKPEETKDIRIESYDDLDFTQNDFIPLTTCCDRMKYAYACMFEDTFVDNVIMDNLPYVEKINKPARRGVTDYYLQEWMKEYNFSLEDFIFNDKYIVLHDNFIGTEIYNLIDRGFIDWDKVEYCSLDEDTVSEGE